MDKKPNQSFNSIFSSQIELNNINNNSGIDSKNNKKNKSNKKFIGKKIKLTNCNLYSNFPGITHFNENSFFIYDLGNIKDFLSIIDNKNTVKLNTKEFNIIKKEIDVISDDIGVLNEKNCVDIPFENINKINEYFNIDKTTNHIIIWISDYINKNDEREKISLQKITNIYNMSNEEKISKSKMYNIFKNKIKLSYLKTSVKNSKIKSPNFIFSIMCFIKIIIRAINLGYKINYMDESAISLKNSNFRCWRKSKEFIFHDYTSNNRSNLLLIVDSKSIIYYKINHSSTNEKTFLEFMDGFLKNRKNDLNKKFILVLDNLACHKTSKIKKFFIENKINVVYNTPYMSIFNCVEIAFRYLKRHLYCNLYSSLEDAENEVKKLLESEEIKVTLKKNYRETLKTYLSYYLENQDINLNNLNYDILLLEVG